MEPTPSDLRRARYVRTLLVWHGKTPGELAELLGLHVDTVYKKLDGRRAIMPGEMLLIAEEFHVDPGLLLRPPLEVAELGVVAAPPSSAVISVKNSCRSAPARHLRVA